MLTHIVNNFNKILRMCTQTKGWEGEKYEIFKKQKASTMGCLDNKDYGIGFINSKYNYFLIEMISAIQEIIKAIISIHFSAIY